MGDLKCSQTGSATDSFLTGDFYFNLTVKKLAVPTATSLIKFLHDNYYDYFIRINENHCIRYFRYKDDILCKCEYTDSWLLSHINIGLDEECRECCRPYPSEAGRYPEFPDYKLLMDPVMKYFEEGAGKGSRSISLVEENLSLKQFVTLSRTFFRRLRR